MSDQRVGAAIRAVRLRRGWRQVDVASRARVSSGLVSAIEQGRIGGVTVDRIRAVAKALDLRVDVLPRWHGAELDRLLNARHNQLGEAVAAYLRSIGWTVAAEVSFAIGGERGVIDILAWHGPSATLLVVELKTEIVNPQEMLGTLDRKTRLAARIARERGWRPASVATWLVVAEGSTNRHRVHRFSTLLRAALPADSRTMARWLVQPSARIAAISFFSNFSQGSLKHGFTGRQRVRVHKSARDERATTVRTD